MSLKYITLNFGDEEDSEIRIPIIDSGNGKDGKLSEEDWRKTLELNQTLIKMAAEMSEVNRQLKEQGGMINAMEQGGWIVPALQSLLRLAPVVIPMVKKGITWVKDKIQQPKSSAGIQPQQDIDYTLNMLRKSYNSSK